MAKQIKGFCFIESLDFNFSSSFHENKKRLVKIRKSSKDKVSLQMKIESFQNNSRKNTVNAVENMVSSFWYRRLKLWLL